MQIGSLIFVVMQLLGIINCLLLVGVIVFAIYKNGGLNNDDDKGGSGSPSDSSTTTA